MLWLSGLVSDEPATPEQVADLLEHGPAVIGAGFALALALGLRSGSDGGPIAIEPPDVRHLLLAPVPRRDVLARPVVQRLRSMAFGGALAGAIAGQLAARRLPGSGEAWAASVAVAAAAMGAAFVAVAVLTHVLRLPRWLATGLAVVVLAAQAASIAGVVPRTRRRHRQLRPVGDAPGARRPRSAVGAVVAASPSPPSLLAGRLRVEPLVRRGDLVSQLHFAVTMQDLRTVVLLRRQLRGEQPRARPWIRLGRRTAGHAGACRVAARLEGASCATRCRGSCGWRACRSPPASPPWPRCAARRRRSSASASPCTCSVSTPSSRCRRRSTTRTTPTASRSSAAGCSPTTSPRRASRWCRSPSSAPSRSASCEQGTWAGALGAVRPDLLGRHVRRDHQHRARRARSR